MAVTMYKHMTMLTLFIFIPPAVNKIIDRGPHKENLFYNTLLSVSRPILWCNTLSVPDVRKVYECDTFCIYVSIIDYVGKYSQRPHIRNSDETTEGKRHYTVMFSSITEQDTVITP
jgi:hypothetical protein